jgi:hypothetical protein
MKIGRFYNITFVTLLTLISSCGKESSDQNALKIIPSHIFYENSKRKTIELNSYMASGLAKVKGCAGFFLKNSNDKNYLATARHCFQYKATEWCKDGEVTDVYNNNKLKCIKIAIGDAGHDLIILELQSSKRDRNNDFLLADFQINQNIALSMMGFPADPYNENTSLKSTENCWVKNPLVKSAFFGPLAISAKVNDKVFSHNCSTYGGNSGGPMFIMGTRVAVGIPDTYVVGAFGNESRDDLSKMSQGILIAEFVNDFRNDLEMLKIKTANQSVAAKDRDYFVEGRFSSTLIPECTINIKKVSYNTNPYPTIIYASFEGAKCSGEETYNCDSSGPCKGVTTPTELNVNQPDSFSYSNRPATNSVIFTRI